MQAIQRAAPDIPRGKGRVVRREFNYIRHGTQTLIGGLEIATGEIYGQIGQTRTEEDFVEFIEYIIDKEDNTINYIFIADQLNTHKSEGLVKLVAKINKDTTDLGVKGKRGILKGMDSRMEYLIKKEGRIRFVFTPKHCSWLNLIEVWFSQLSKRVLQFGNFISQEDLAQKVLNYLNYYNKHFAKSFKWSASKKTEANIMIQKVKRCVAKFKG
jgi:transposase